MSGLNDPFLLDDVMEDKTPMPVKAFKEMTPGEVPEISDHVTLIAAPIPDAESDGSDGIVEKTGEIASVAIEEYQVAMRDLSLLSDRIQSEGGMSLSIAQESLAVLPGFISDDVRPMGYFTKHPSRTQLNEALEAIDSAKETFFQKAVRKIKEFLKALADRIKSVYERFTGKDKTAELEKKIRDTVDELDRAKRYSQALKAEMANYERKINSMNASAAAAAAAAGKDAEKIKELTQALEFNRDRLAKALRTQSEYAVSKNEAETQLRREREENAARQKTADDIEKLTEKKRVLEKTIAELRQQSTDSPEFKKIAEAYGKNLSRAVYSLFNDKNAAWKDFVKGETEETKRTLAAATVFINEDYDINSILDDFERLTARVIKDMERVVSGEDKQMRSGESIIERITEYKDELVAIANGDFNPSKIYDYQQMENLANKLVLRTLDAGGAVGFDKQFSGYYKELTSAVDDSRKAIEKLDSDEDTANRMKVISEYCYDTVGPVVNCTRDILAIFNQLVTRNYSIAMILKRFNETHLENCFNEAKQACGEVLNEETRKVCEASLNFDQIKKVVFK